MAWLTTSNPILTSRTGTEGIFSSVIGRISKVMRKAVFQRDVTVVVEYRGLEKSAAEQLEKDVSKDTVFAFGRPVERTTTAVVRANEAGAHTVVVTTVNSVYTEKTFDFQGNPE